MNMGMGWIPRRPYATLPNPYTQGQLLRAGQGAFVDPAKATFRFTVFEIRKDPVQIISVLRGTSGVQIVVFV